MEGGKKKSQDKPTGRPKTFLEGRVEGRDRGPFLSFTLKKKKKLNSEVVKEQCVCYIKFGYRKRYKCCI